MSTSHPSHAAADCNSDVTLRDGLAPDDDSAIRDIVASTGFFNPREIEVAVELVREGLARGDASGYRFLVASLDGRAIGYTCYGPVACTAASFDLYWIAVHADHRRRRIGRLLLLETERRIAAAGGERVYIDTSSRAQYAPTRRFYERHGYVCAALLPDFYARGDHRLIYSKQIVAAV